MIINIKKKYVVWTSCRWFMSWLTRGLNIYFIKYIWLKMFVIALCLLHSPMNSHWECVVLPEKFWRLLINTTKWCRIMKKINYLRYESSLWLYTTSDIGFYKILTLSRLLSSSFKLCSKHLFWLPQRPLLSLIDSLSDPWIVWRL